MHETKRLRERGGETSYQVNNFIIYFFELFHKKNIVSSNQ